MWAQIASVGVSSTFFDERLGCQVNYCPTNSRKHPHYTSKHCHSLLFYFCPTMFRLSRFCY